MGHPESGLIWDGLSFRPLSLARAWAWTVDCASPLVFVDEVVDDTVECAGPASRLVTGCTLRVFVPMPAHPLSCPVLPLQVVTSTKPEGFTPKVIKQTSEYLYVEYEVRLDLLPFLLNTLHCNLQSH